MLKRSDQLPHRKSYQDFSDKSMASSDENSFKHQNQKSKQYQSLEQKHKNLQKSYDRLKSYFFKMQHFYNSQMIKLQKKLEKNQEEISDLLRHEDFLIEKISSLQNQINQSNILKRENNPCDFTKPSLKISSPTFKKGSNNYQKENPFYKRKECNQKNFTELQDDLKNSFQIQYGVQQIQRQSTKSRSISQQKNLQNEQNLQNQQQENQSETKSESKSQNLSQYSLCLLKQCCGNKECMKNYFELKSLKEYLSELSQRMQQIYLKIAYQFQNQNLQKNIAEHKQKLESSWKENTDHDFVYYEKSEYLMEKIEQKVKDFLKVKNQRNRNPILLRLKQRFQQIDNGEYTLREISDLNTKIKSTFYEPNYESVQKQNRSQAANQEFEYTKQSWLKSKKFPPSLIDPNNRQNMDQLFQKMMN